MFDKWLRKDKEQLKNIGWSIALAMDVSGSMAGEKLREAKKALLAFLDEVDFGQMGVALVTFGKKTSLRQRLTQEKHALAREIDRYSAGNGTPFLQGMRIADGQVLSSASGQRLMVIASDGMPNDASEQAILAYGKQLKDQGIKIITISIGHDAHTAFLEQLASSPQDFHLASSAIELKPTFQKIAKGLVLKR